MHALVVSFQVFALVFAGALVGIAIRRAAPENHFVPEAKDTVRLAIGLILTMTGLVLGMLVSSAKTFYEGEKTQVAEMSSQIVLLNDLLSTYGPETNRLVLKPASLLRMLSIGFGQRSRNRLNSSRRTLARAFISS